MSTSALFDLQDHPLWREQDLGKPIPPSPHATSVAMPHWDHVIGYEERRPDVMSRLACGYPRFLIHPFVQRLFDRATEALAATGELATVFPARDTAERCVAFVTDKGGTGARVARWEDTELYAVVVPEDHAALVKSFWQHYGEIVSSRRAEAALEGRPRNPEAGHLARQTIRTRIAELGGVAETDVALYSSGMGALSAALRICRRRRPGARTVQLGFPYVDGLKMQDVAGPGVHFFPTCGTEDVEAVVRLAESEPLAAVFCEIPGNPLLSSPPIRDLSEALHARGVPLIVDDTVATVANVDLAPHADMVASSLTKLFSGTGDVMAGALVISPTRAHCKELHALLAEDDHHDILWDDDAIVLEENSRDFVTRARRVNETALALCEHLRTHPAVASVHYPAFTAREAYDQVRRDDGGFGCLFSLELRAPGGAPAFYDALRVCKGPSLGTNYTLASPYTLLAHYDELAWAEGHGIARYLIRVSVGLEDAEDLKGRFDDALGAAAASGIA